MKEIPRAVFVTGTDTGVGKTVVTAALACLLSRKGLDVGVVKPFQTGTDLGELADAEFVCACLGRDFDPDEVSPCRLRAPLSPYFAARAEGAEIPLHGIISRTEDYVSRRDVTLIEGAGGLFVPVTETVMMADLALSLGAPALLVARPGLGTVNHTMLSLGYAERKGLPVLGVVLSGFPEPADIASGTNPVLFRDLFSLRILGVLPRLPGVSVERGLFPGIREGAESFFGPFFGGSFSAERFTADLERKTKG